jgi:hypothetical protein
MGTLFSTQEIAVPTGPYDSSSMAARGRIGGLTTQFRHDPRQTMAPARAGKRQRLADTIRQSHPDLSDDQVQEKVNYAIRVEMARLNYQRWHGPSAKASTRPEGGIE